ncbi:MAG TPA: hypothetical protein V6D18_02980 [Thermosynechococcaceae cyanobacterium]
MLWVLLGKLVNRTTTPEFATSPSGLAALVSKQAALTNGMGRN